MKTETFRQKNNHSLLSQILKRLKIERGPDDRGEHIAWCCFHADGEGKPPHQPNLYVSERGFICHACGEKGSLIKLARHLEIDIEPSDDGFEAVYDYRDEHGNLLFQVVRVTSKPIKKFFVRRPNGPGKWKLGLGEIRPVLYRLPELSANPDKTVFISEGEKDVNRLAGEGLLATTNPFGGGKWREAYSETLESRDVVICPDNDGPGWKHAQQVAKSLSGKAKSIKLVELPGLSEKGDVSDWLDSGKTIDDLQVLVEKTALLVPHGDGSEVGSSDAPGSPPAEPTESQTRQLIELILSSGIELFKDQRGMPYASVPVDNGRRIHSLDSREFKTWVSKMAYTEMKWPLSDQTLTTVNRNLACEAIHNGKQHELHVRTAKFEGAIWHDLDGQSAVRIVPGDWQVIGNPPILFKSLRHQSPLPIPVKGGDPKKVLDFLNIQDEELRILFMCWLVVAFVPHIPIPTLAIYGPPGSAKTSLARVVKRLIDPAIPEVQGSLRNLKDFPITASCNRVLIYDNVSRITAEQSDALCGAVTGQGSSNRRLYTDEDPFVIEFKNVVLFTGVDLIAERSDLLNRSILLPMCAVDPRDRLYEEELWEEFEGMRPGILGGLLDCVASMLHLKNKITLKERPRMADFARYGVAAAKSLSYDPLEFLRIYQENESLQNEVIIEASPVLQALMIFMEDVEEWSGSATELLGLLTETAGQHGISTRNRSWPEKSNKLSRELSYVQKTLMDSGIELCRRKTTAGRVITLRKVVRRDDTIVLQDDTVRGIVPLETASEAERDDRDDKDDTLADSAGVVGHHRSTALLSNDLGKGRV
jgi:hypothetical protein